MINVIGSFFDTSGYASHCRSLSNALARETKVKLTTSLVPGWERLVNDEELKMIKQEEDFDTNLIITNPVFWRHNAYAKHNYAFLIWEGDKIPKWMVEECLNENIEKILVVSMHTAEALSNSTTDDKILDKVVMAPHGVDLKTFYPIESKHDKFTFFMNKGFRNMEDRGGVQYGIKAYLEEFDGSDTELIIKINPAYGIPNIAEMFPELKGRNDVKFITSDLSFKQINELYNKCDVFVSPTRAEAFNLPCLESLACGKPVITTNFGGQTDFCNKENSWKIGGDLVEVEHELEYEGVRWLTPNIEELREAMRDAFECNLCCAMDSEALKTAKKYSWDNTAKLIMEVRHGK